MSLQKIGQAAIRIRPAQLARCMSGHAPAHFKTNREIDTEAKTTMDFHPVPQGSWQENYNRRNRKWTAYVGINSVIFVVTLYFMYKNDCFYLHSTPPIGKN